MKSPRCSTNASRSASLATLVLVDHATVGVTRTLSHVLTTDERETRRAVIFLRGRRHRAPDPATDPCSSVNRYQYCGAASARPRGCDMSNPRLPKSACCSRNHLREIHVLRYFDLEVPRGTSVRGRPARPQDHAIRLGVSRCDALRKKLTSSRHLEPEDCAQDPANASAAPKALAAATNCLRVNSDVWLAYEVRKWQTIAAAATKSNRLQSVSSGSKKLQRTCG